MNMFERRYSLITKIQARGTMKWKTDLTLIDLLMQ